ncbi:MAG: hypothetical protein AB7G47_15650 [Mycolicibacterium sp.]|uniref:hypothetical protein n=1 Tax=Mycolicibacterium sp. TaxID=2320850 RepID=UPI003D0A2856
MSKLVIAGVGLVVSVQALAFIALERHLVVAAAGIAVAAVLLAVRAGLARHPAGEPAAAAADDAGEPLRRWVARTETLVSWSDGSRADWDRRLRPLLARQFELASGQRKAKDPKAFYATGRMLFGPQLWPWVDPENIVPRGGQQPGPGRDTLNEILQRLERL